MFLKEIKTGWVILENLRILYDVSGQKTAYKVIVPTLVASIVLSQSTVTLEKGQTFEFKSERTFGNGNQSDDKLHQLQ